MSIKVLIEKRVNDFIKDYPDFNSEGENKKFLLFSIFHILKYLNVAYEDVLDGLIDNSNDYGLDGVFVFSSGELIREDEDLDKQISKEDKIKIQFIQVSRDAGFAETAMLKLKNGIEEIFDLKAKSKGNKDYIRKTELIRNTWEYCFKLGCIKNIEIEIVYVTLNDNEEVNPKVKSIETKILDFLRSQGLLSTKVKYVGIPSLYKIITAESYDKDLIFKDVVSYAESYNKKIIGFYGLVKIGNFLRFITDENGEIVERYFEGNIRDFYGITKRVNEKIKNTLSGSDRMNLWCLNNGITIICDKIDQRGKEIKLSNFHIVNGCQTAHVIYECMEILKDDDSSEIFIKIIQTTDEKVGNDVIDATNSQTAVPPILLHSNELIQQNIEEHLLKHTKPQLYYERRMNYYKRRHKSAYKIVTMLKLFQVFYSIFVKKPSAARGRPTESFEKDYKSVFDTSFDYDSYLFAYLLYLKLNNMNREEAAHAVKDNDILFLIRKYGMLHILRIAFTLLIGCDGKINLQDKKNIFTAQKKKWFALLDNKKALDKLYKHSIMVLERSIKRFIKNSKSTKLNYNIMKTDDLDKFITKEFLEVIK